MNTTETRPTAHSAPPARHATQTANPRATYLANLAALYDSDPELAAEIDRLPFFRTPPLELARSGEPTVRMAADDGQSLWMHSRYQPMHEARTLIDALPADGAANFVLLGLGLGHHLSAILARTASPCVVVFEPDLGLLKAALCATDCADLLRRGRLAILTRAEKSILHQRLLSWSGELLLGLHIVSPPHAARRNAAEYARFRTLLAEFIEYCRMQVVTLLKVARTTFRNVACNLPHFAANAGIETLAGRAAGKPAIILAAGPSLARHLDEALALRDRAVLIAVQTVFKMIRARGSLPHFVTSLDFHDVSAEFFEGVGATGDCVLVAEPKVATPVLDLFPGRRVVLSHGLYRRLLREAAPPHGGLKSGGTVAHLAYYLARHLGCDPIIFVGQDLCFSDGLFYPPGTPIDQVWEPELGRFQTIEMKQWERIVRNRPILRSFRDAAGRPTLTDNLLAHYAEHFEADFAGSPVRLIRAGRTGLPLAGTETMPLAEAARRFCNDPLPPDWLEIPEAATPDARALAGAIEARISEVREARTIASEMRGLLEELTGLVDRPNEFNRRLVRVDALRVRMMELDAAYSLVTDATQAAELRRHSADRRLSGAAHSADATRAQLRRDADFVREFIDGCEFVLETLPIALRRVQERLS